MPDKCKDGYDPFEGLKNCRKVGHQPAQGLGLVQYVGCPGCGKNWRFGQLRFFTTEEHKTALQVQLEKHVERLRRARCLINSCADESPDRKARAILEGGGSDG